MALVNVRRDVSDAFYRYKMERLQTKIEGKGNGIKTVVVNLSSVAASLARPGSYVIKYFGFELGAQTNTLTPRTTVGSSTVPTMLPSSRITSMASSTSLFSAKSARTPRPML
ncbi:hypothetical protein NXS19_009074 [Fusarium pseudograminearum]|nr:hypothetical protein NXS19_009074 [Fusarium pseudograminearum]